LLSPPVTLPKVVVELLPKAPKREEVVSVGLIEENEKPLEVVEGADDALSLISSILLSLSLSVLPAPNNEVAVLVVEGVKDPKLPKGEAVGFSAGLTALGSEKEKAEVVVGVEVVEVGVKLNGVFGYHRLVSKLQTSFRRPTHLFFHFLFLFFLSKPSKR
jgi:hypothetical protein